MSIRFKRRIKFLKIIGVIVWIGLLFRLVYLQIIEHKDFQTIALEQHIVRRGLSCERGEILDRNLISLTTNVNAKRLYPLGTGAGQVIGFVGKEGRGMSGIEYAYDELLKGNMGWITLQRDARGRVYPSGKYSRRDATEGAALVLTLDMRIQLIAEEELKKTTEQFQAASGTVVVLQPKTGAVLAMANYPLFNPNLSDSGRENMQNNSISFTFEPGSTFKIIPVAAALENEIAHPSDILDGEYGSTMIGKHTIHEAEDKKFGRLSVKEALAKSCNVCMVHLAQKVGGNKLFEMARAFGFGCETGVKLPGEEKGILSRPKEWSPLQLATIAFGQGVSVTPLQLTNAFSCIANKGKLLIPRFLLGIFPSTGEKFMSVEKVEFVRQAINTVTAESLKEMLVLAVENGTGQRAKIDGIKIAGKTGTAQKKDGDGRGYSKDKFVASFVGFFPADEPEFVIGVVIDEPKGSIYGGLVAAPLFRKIALKILALPSLDEDKISQEQEQLALQDDAF